MSTYQIYGISGYNAQDYQSNKVDLSSVHDNYTLIATGEAAADATFSIAGFSGFAVFIGDDMALNKLLVGTSALYTDYTNPLTMGNTGLYVYDSFPMPSGDIKEFFQSTDGYTLEDNYMNGGGVLVHTTRGASTITVTIHDMPSDAASDENNAIMGTVAADSLSGLGGNDFLIGAGGSDTLEGDAGNDTLEGGTGNDTMAGGAGNDLFLVDSANDFLSENPGEGIDSIQSALTWSLGSNLENLILTGIAAINGTGNDEHNQLTGNRAANQLTGGLGNDTLDGSAGSDTIIGGAGDDYYRIDVSTDAISENPGEGTDTVESGVTHVLQVNFEHLILTGSANNNGTGNSANNQIIGNSGSNILDGGLGNDTLVGGAGNDTYLLDNPNDQVTENVAEGTDTIRAGCDYTLGAHLENLVLLTGALNGTGNELNNQLTGNAQNNTIDGGLGTDTYIVSGARTDYRFECTSLTEVRIIHNASGDTDTLTGIEKVRFGNGTEGLLTIADLLANTASLFDDSYTGGDLTHDTFDGLGGNDTILGLGGNDSLLGNSGNDSITGGLGNDTLDGGLDNDTLIGGGGNDTYLFEDAGDQLTENANEGTDTLRTVFNTTLAGSLSNIDNLILLGAAINGTGNDQANALTGNANANSLIGAAGNDTLDGGTGADTLIGGIGDDTYTMDNLGDVLTENAGEGTDTLYISIHNTGAPIILTAPANIENIFFTIDALGVTLATSGTSAITGSTGIDNVAYTGGGSYTLPAGVENLRLTQSTGNIGGTGGAEHNLLEGNSGANLLDGGAGNDTLKGYAGEDILLGGSGNDLLNGGKGADRLEGGIGDDTYTIDNSGDRIVEATGAGTDTVRSSLRSTTLGDNLENLVLEGAAKANGTGNALANQLTGNGKANCLTGGAGADTFIFNTALGPLNVDTLTDFTTGQDKIALDDAIFGTLTGGWYHSVTALNQADADDRILYDAGSGALYYDADGSGATAAIRFAILQGAPTLSAAEFQVV